MKIEKFNKEISKLIKENNNENKEIESAIINVTYYKKYDKLFNNCGTHNNIEIINKHIYSIEDNNRNIIKINYNNTEPVYVNLNHIKKINSIKINNY